MRSAAYVPSLAGRFGANIRPHASVDSAVASQARGLQQLMNFETFEDQCELTSEKAL